MNALVLTDFFTHQHNQLVVAKQEYEAAKLHFREVCMNRIVSNPDHNRRFRDAVVRKNAARDRFVKLLASRD